MFIQQYKFNWSIQPIILSIKLWKLSIKLQNEQMWPQNNRLLIYFNIVKFGINVLVTITCATLLRLYVVTPLPPPPLSQNTPLNPRAIIIQHFPQLHTITVQCEIPPTQQIHIQCKQCLCTHGPVCEGLRPRGLSMFTW